MADVISTTGLGRSYGATVALHPLTMAVTTAGAALMPGMLASM